MRRRLVAIAVVGLWLVMMATLVRRWILEVRPELVPGTYQSVLTRERRNYQWRKGIYWPTAAGLQRVGHTQTVFHYRNDAGYTIYNTTRVEVAVPGFLPRPTTFELDASAVVDATFALQRITMRLESEAVRARGFGRVANGKLALYVTVNDQEREPVVIDVPRGEVVAQGLSPLLALPPLKVGMKWSVLVVDPFRFRPSKVELEVVRREPLEWEGQRHDTYVVAIRAGGIPALAWVTPEGEVLREQTLFGLTFIKERVSEEGDAKQKREKPTTGRRGSAQRGAVVAPPQLPVLARGGAELDACADAREVEQGVVRRQAHAVALAGVGELDEPGDRLAAAEARERPRELGLHRLVALGVVEHAQQPGHRLPVVPAGEDLNGQALGGRTHVVERGHHRAAVAPRIVQRQNPTLEDQLTSRRGLAVAAQQLAHVPAVHARHEPTVAVVASHQQHRTHSHILEVENQLHGGTPATSGPRRSHVQV